MHCPQFFKGITGDFCYTPVYKNNFIVFQDYETVMNILSHHPEPLFTLTDFPLCKNMCRDVIEDNSKTFSAIFKNGGHRFLFKESFSVILNPECYGIFFFSRPGFKCFK